MSVAASAFRERQNHRQPGGLWNSRIIMTVPYDIVIITGSGIFLSGWRQMALAKSFGRAARLTAAAAGGHVRSAENYPSRSYPTPRLAAAIIVIFSVFWLRFFTQFRWCMRSSGFDIRSVFAGKFRVIPSENVQWKTHRDQTRPGARTVFAGSLIFFDT